jgi:hypothetical protein
MYALIIHSAEAAARQGPCATQALPWHAEKNLKMVCPVYKYGWCSAQEGKT